MNTLKKGKPISVIFVGERSRMEIGSIDAVRFNTLQGFISKEGTDGHRLVELEMERLCIFLGKKKVQVIKVTYEDVTEEYWRKK